MNELKSYIKKVLDNGFSPEIVEKTVAETCAEWKQSKANEKIERSRAAMIAAVANYLESLGQTVEQEDIDRTVATLEKLEALKPNDVQVSIDVDADERLRKFLRGIM